MKAKRIPELDFLKCVCIILMVVFHLVYIEELYPETKDVVYTFHMPIFLAISGYFVDIRMGFGKFRRRLMRLLVPYIIMESAYTLAAGVLPIREHIDGMSLTVFLDKLLLHPLGPYWFLHTLIAAQVVCFSVACVGKLLRLNDMSMLILLGAAFFIGSGWLHLYVAENIVYFFLGILLGRLNISGLNISWGAFLALLPIALIIVSGGHKTFGLPCVALVALFAIVFSAVWRTIMPQALKPMALRIGENTLPILLYSPLFTFPLKYLVPFFSFDHTGLLYALLSVTIVISGSLIIDCIIKRCKRKMKIRTNILLLAMAALPMLSFAQSQEATESKTSPTRVLYIGDSITDGGWGRSGGSMKSSDERNHKDLNHLFGHGYMEMSAATLMAEAPGRYECFNRGISGNTLADLEARWQKDCLDLQPDVISILIGTNDVEEHLSPIIPTGEGGSKETSFDVKAWENRYDKLIEKTKQSLPNVRLMLCTPFVAKVGKRGAADNYALRDSLIRECAKAVERLAKKHNATLVPFASMIDELIQHSPQQGGAGGGLWLWDGIHPTSACHKKMSDLWLKAFCK